jgi:Macrocin-O-methyltransferase (TylF)
MSQMIIKTRIKQAALNSGIRTNQLRPSNALNSLFKVAASRFGYELRSFDPNYPIVKPIDTNKVEILKNREFHASLIACGNDTNLDDARLANIWAYAKLSGPGSMLEVGSWHGGGALHIANACPERPIFVFDPFSDSQSFESLDEALDTSFALNQFTDTSEGYVRNLFASNNKKAKIVKGFFPASALNVDLGEIAFCHLDVDVYDATKKSLYYLSGRLAKRSFILLDDYQREAKGVDVAVDEFLRDHPRFRCFPLHPSQGLVFSLDLWD